jgi:uncharacterized repeat protein (TIGR01451 family)
MEAQPTCADSKAMIYSAYVYQWDYVQPADLALSASVTPSTAAPGERITYTLAFSNAGGRVATSVVITDLIPADVVGTSFISRGAGHHLADRQPLRLECAGPGGR